MPGSKQSQLQMKKGISTSARVNNNILFSRVTSANSNGVASDSNSNIKRVNEELRQHIFKMKAEIDMEKAKLKQVRRDKVTEIKRIRDECSFENTLNLEANTIKLTKFRENEIKKLRETLTRDKDSEIKQIIRFKDEELKVLQKAMQEDHDRAMKDAEEKFKCSRLAQKGKVGGGDLERRLRQEILDLKKNKEEIEESYRKQANIINEKKEMITKMRSDFEKEKHKIIKESRKEISKNISEIKQLRQYMDEQKNETSKANSYASRLIAEKEDLAKRLKQERMNLIKETSFNASIGGSLVNLPASDGSEYLHLQMELQNAVEKNKDISFELDNLRDIHSSCDDVGVALMIKGNELNNYVQQLKEKEEECTALLQDEREKLNILLVEASEHSNEMEESIKYLHVEISTLKKAVIDQQHQIEILTLENKNAKKKLENQELEIAELHKIEEECRASHGNLVSILKGNLRNLEYKCCKLETRESEFMKTLEELRNECNISLPIFNSNMLLEVRDFGVQVPMETADCHENTNTFLSIEELSIKEVDEDIAGIDSKSKYQNGSTADYDTTIPSSFFDRFQRCVKKNVGLFTSYIAKYTYDPNLFSPNADYAMELPLIAGMKVYVYGNIDENGFYLGETKNGQRGLVPSNLVERISSEDMGHDSEDDVCDDLVPPPQCLCLDQQLNNSVVITWQSPTNLNLCNIKGYSVYVNGSHRQKVLGSTRTKALVSHIDQEQIYRISVCTITMNGRESEDTLALLSVGSGNIFTPYDLAVSSITSLSAHLSWRPSNSTYFHVIYRNNENIMTAKQGICEYTLTNLIPDTDYSITIEARESMNKHSPDWCDEIIFRTLKGAIPDPPLFVECKRCNEHLHVSWLLLTISKYGTSNGSKIDGYSVYVNNIKCASVTSSTIDHVNMPFSELKRIFHDPDKLEVFVRTLSSEGESSESNVCLIDMHMIDEYESDQNIDNVMERSLQLNKQVIHKSADILKLYPPGKLVNESYQIKAKYDKISVDCSSGFNDFTEESGIGSSSSNSPHLDQDSEINQPGGDIQCNHKESFVSTWSDINISHPEPSLTRTHFNPENEPHLLRNNHFDTGRIVISDDELSIIDEVTEPSISSISLESNSASSVFEVTESVAASKKNQDGDGEAFGIFEEKKHESTYENTERRICENSSCKAIIGDIFIENEVPDIVVNNSSDLSRKYLMKSPDIQDDSHDIIAIHSELNHENLYEELKQDAYEDLHVKNSSCKDIIVQHVSNMRNVLEEVSHYSNSHSIPAHSMHKAVSQNDKFRNQVMNSNVELSEEKKMESSENGEKIKVFFHGEVNENSSNRSKVNNLGFSFSSYSQNIDDFSFGQIHNQCKMSLNSKITSDDNVSNIPENKKLPVFDKQTNNTLDYSQESLFSDLKTLINKNLEESNAQMINGHDSKEFTNSEPIASSALKIVIDKELEGCTIQVNTFTGKVDVMQTHMIDSQLDITPTLAIIEAQPVTARDQMLDTQIYKNDHLNDSSPDGYHNSSNTLNLCRNVNGTKFEDNEIYNSDNIDAITNTHDISNHLDILVGKEPNQNIIGKQKVLPEGEIYFDKSISETKQVKSEMLFKQKVSFPDDSKSCLTASSDHSSTNQSLEISSCIGDDSSLMKLSSMKLSGIVSSDFYNDLHRDTFLDSVSLISDENNVEMSQQELLDNKTYQMEKSSELCDNEVTNIRNHVHSLTIKNYNEAEYTWEKVGYNDQNKTFDDIINHDINYEITSLSPGKGKFNLEMSKINPALTNDNGNCIDKYKNHLTSSNFFKNRSREICDIGTVDKKQYVAFINQGNFYLHHNEHNMDDGKRCDVSGKKNRQKLLMINKPWCNIYNLVENIDLGCDDAEHDEFNVTSMSKIDSSVSKIYSVVSDNKGISDSKLDIDLPQTLQIETAVENKEKFQCSSPLNSCPDKEINSTFELFCATHYNDPTWNTIQYEKEEKFRTFTSNYSYDPSTMSPNTDKSGEELAFCEGDLIMVYGDIREDGFYFGELNGNKGFVPGNLVSEVLETEIIPHNVEPINSIEHKKSELPEQLNNEDSFFDLHIEKGSVPTTKVFEHYQLPSQNCNQSSTNCINCNSIEFESRQKQLSSTSRLSASTQDLSKGSDIDISISRSSSIPNMNSNFFSKAMFEQADPYQLKPVKMIALFDYDAASCSPNVDSEIELSFRKGDILEKYGETDEDGFYAGVFHGVKGLIPSNFVREATEKESLRVTEASSRSSISVKKKTSLFKKSKKIFSRLKGK